jgi:phage terminase small subunit
MAGNANSGRRPQPTALKVLKGVTRRDRINPEEPIAPHDAVTQPDGLSVAASRVWAEIAPVCLAMKTLTAADVSAFAKLCELESSSRANARKKDEDPESFSIRIELDTAAALRAYYDYFGMTPMARSRIRVPKAEPVASKWAGIVG